MNFSALLRSTAVGFFFKIYGALISLLVVVIASRNLSTYDFGLFAFYISFSGFFAYLCAFGQEQLLIKKAFFFRNNQSMPRLVSTSLAAVIVVSFFWMVFFLLLWLLNISDYGLVYLLCVFTVPLISVRRLHTSILRNVGYSKIAVLSESVVYPTLLVVFSFVYFYIVGQFNFYIFLLIIFFSVFISIIFNYFLFYSLGFSFLSEPKFSKVKINLCAAVPFFLFSLTEAISTFADKMLLAYLLGPEKLAIYHISLRVAALALFFESAILLSTLSVISQNYAKKCVNEVQSVIAKQGLLNFGFFLLFFITCYFTAPLLLSMFGSEYVEGANILILSSLGLVINSLFGAPAYVMTVTGLEQYAYRINLFFLTSYLLMIPIALSLGELYAVVLLKVVIDIVRLACCWQLLRIRTGLNTFVFCFR